MSTRGHTRVTQFSQSSELPKEETFDAIYSRLNAKLTDSFESIKNYGENIERKCEFVKSEIEISRL
jgi:hypothetical protein